MRISLLSLTMLLACGEEPTKITDTQDQDQPNIEINVEAVDFGELLLGSLSTETITIKNTGTDDLVIQSIYALPPFTSPSAGGFSLAPEQETSVTVQFIPIDYNPVQGVLTITSNDPDQSAFELPILGATITDVDGDGYDTELAGGTDCNDDDEDINPDALDEWYDGIDSNCDDADDYDQDGDGFQTNIWNDEVATGGGDCQDNNPTMYPGAPDTWYDGVDSNCDGHDDFDQDGDGSRSQLHGRGSDCNDLDPEINTNGLEAINGLDDDCDGAADLPVPAWNADRIIVGTAGNDKAGFTLTVGDIDGDNRDDIIVGLSGYQSKGGVAILTQNSLPVLSQSSLSNAYNIFSGQLSNDAAGSALSFLSDPGKGVPVLAVGAPGVSTNTGRVYLVEGDEVVYGGDLDDAYLTINGAASSYFGDGIVQDIDMDGDGMSDLLTHYRSGSNNYYGLLYGDAALGGTIAYTDMDALISTTGTNANTWRHIPSTGDLDGDGLDDFVHCDLRQSTGSNAYYISEANVLWGDSVRYETVGSAAVNTIATSIVSASGSSSALADGYILQAACGIMPDWNGDGMDEFWTFFSQSDDNFTGVYVFNGSADWKLNGADLNPNTDASYYFLVGDSSEPVATFREMGDWDGDGISEVGITFGTTNNGSGSGKVWMVSSQLPPGLNYTQADLAALVVGDDEYGQVHYGNVLSPVPGDFNNDGMVDWLATDWGYTGATATSTGATNTGALYLTFQR